MLKSTWDDIEKELSRLASQFQISNVTSSRFYGKDLINQTKLENSLSNSSTLETNDIYFLAQIMQKTENPLSRVLIDIADARGHPKARLYKAKHQLKSNDNNDRGASLKVLSELSKNGDVEAALLFADVLITSKREAIVLKLLSQENLKSNSKILLKLAVLQADQKLIKEANESLNLAAKMGNAQAFFKLAMQQKVLKDRIYNLLKAAGGGVVLAAHNLGDVYQQQGRLELAMDWYAIAAEQGFQPSQFNLGILLNMQGNTIDGQKWLEKAKGLDSNYKNVHI